MVGLAKDLKACLPVFLAFGDENRQSILLTLLNNYGGMRVGELTQHTNLSRPAVSHHLKILKEAGIVDMFKKRHNALLSCNRKPGTMGADGAGGKQNKQADKRSCHKAKRRKSLLCRHRIAEREKKNDKLGSNGKKALCTQLYR